MWFKGDQTRLHPFNAPCIYRTGVVCLDQRKVEAAVYVILLSPASLSLLLRSYDPSSPVSFSSPPSSTSLKK